MSKGQIIDTTMIRMIDDGVSQAEVARKFKVSRSAVSKRLKQLRGRTSYAVAGAKIRRVIDSKLNVVDQLQTINRATHDLLTQAQNDANLSVKLIAEIRNQLRLMMDIYDTLCSIEAVDEFQEVILEVLNECEPELRKEVIFRLNEKRNLRAALRFK